MNPLQPECHWAWQSGFKLTKWSSNNRRVIAPVPSEDRSSNITNIYLTRNYQPTKRVLRVRQDLEGDVMSMCINNAMRDPEHHKSKTP